MANSSKDDIKAWLESWYAVADKCVPANSVKFFASDCIVRFNNQDPAQGRDAAQQAFQATAPSIEWMKHEILDIDIIGDRVYNECDVHFVAKGDPEQKEVVMHRMDVYDRVPKGQPEEGLIRVWIAYFDPGPLRERVMAAKAARGDAQSGGRVY